MLLAQRPLGFLPLAWFSSIVGKSMVVKKSCRAIFLWPVLKCVIFESE